MNNVNQQKLGLETTYLRIPDPSPYQTDIFEWVVNGRGHGFVRAVAGSGKTTTIVHASTLLRTPAIMLAFNKAIAKELSERLRGTTTDVKTLHALGMKALRDDSGRKLDVKGDKMYRVMRDLLERLVAAGKVADVVPTNADLSRLRGELSPAQRAAGIETKERPIHKQKAVVSAMVDLVDKARVELSDLSSREDFHRVMAGYGIELPPALLPYAQALGELAIVEGVTLYRDKLIVDFTDMIWLPAHLKIRPKRYGFVFVDEAQDLSRAQLELAISACGPGGRLLFVGDPNQAIYAFAGADSKSVEKILDRVKPKVMPLSVCYRCDEAIIDLAKELVHEIQPALGVSAGLVREDVPEREAMKEMRDGDLVLCRTTAPLISVCLRLIRSGISAAVRGRDIGKALTSVVEIVAKHPEYRFDAFPHWLKAWKEDAFEKIEAEDMGPRREEAMIQAIEDRYASIVVVWDATPGLLKTEDLINAIDDLFAVEDPAVSLSTVHRAKGLEADRVYVLRRDLMPHPMAKTPEAQKQEVHLEYVCYTRAKHELVFIGDKKKRGPRPGELDHRSAYELAPLGEDDV